MKTPTNFKDAYQILKTNVERLEASDTLDVDSLVTTVEESIAAYKVCQERIGAVERALQKAFLQNELNDELIDGDGEHDE